MPPQTPPSAPPVPPRIVVCGEALIDLTHARTDEPGVYHAYVGGGPHNTAIGLGRLGVPTAFLGRLSSDRFGQLLRESLASAGVDRSLIVDTDDPTMLAVVSLSAEGHASYAFYTAATADVGLTTDLLPALPESVRALHFGTLSLALEPMGTTLAALVEREAGHRLIALDPNVRLSVIRDAAAYRDRLVQLIARTDVLKVSDADLEGLWPEIGVDEAAARLAASGPVLTCVTRGGEGATVHYKSDVFDVPAPAVDVADTIGAGDTFNGGLLAWLDRHDALDRAGVEALGSENVGRAVAFAVAAAAVTCSRSGANPPWATELTWT